MKKYVRLSALLLASVMLFGCGSKKEQVEEVQTEAVTNVEVQNPTLATMKDEYSYSGTIAPKETVNVVGTLSANVTATYYEVGEKVAKDALMFTVDTKDVDLSVNTAQAALSTADANIRSAQTNLELANGSSMESQIAAAKNAITTCETALENAKTAVENAKKGVDNAQFSVNNAQTSVDNATLAYNNALDSYNESRELYEVGGISKEMLDNANDAVTQTKNALDVANNGKNTAQIALQTAQNSLTTAQRGVTSAQTALDKAREDYNRLVNQTKGENVRRAQDNLNTAKASRSSAEAGVATAKSRLNDSKVYAPIAGTVLEKKVTTGSYYGAGQVAYTIVDTSTVNVEVKTSESVTASVYVGMPVTLSIPSASSEPFTGSISEISPGANSDGTYTTKIEIPNADGKLKSGMFAQIAFSKNTRVDTVVLPRNAVILEGEEHFVYVNDNGTAKKVKVEIGIDNGKNIEIISGVTTGDSVVTTGQTYLKDGDKINVTANNGKSTGADEKQEATTAEEAKK